MIRGYSQDNLASYLGKSQNWVSAVESGKLQPAFREKKAISDFLEVALEDLENTNFTFVKEGTVAVSSRIDFLEQELKSLKELMLSIKNRLD